MVWEELSGGEVVPGGGGGLYTPMVVARPCLHIVRGQDLGTTMGGPAGGVASLNEILTRS